MGPLSYLCGSWYNPWDMTDVLALLIEERDRLNEAIAVLGGPRRRGRLAGGGKKKAVWEGWCLRP